MSSAMSNNVIRWFESAALDDPKLRSPQPCKRGIHCDYKLTDEISGELVRACCSGVHPGEEGTGRRLFPARILDDGREQPACVRLTGAAQGFYERRRLRLSWAEWCERHEIPFTPALPGQPFEPVVRKPLGGRRAQDSFVPSPADAMPQGGSIAPARLTKNQRKRANKRAAKAEASISCEDLEVELLSGAHSPKPSALQGMRLGEASIATGTCSAGCACFFGGICIDASNDACATPFLIDPPALVRICPAIIAEEASIARPRIPVTPQPNHRTFASIGGSHNPVTRQPPHGRFLCMTGPRIPVTPQANEITASAPQPPMPLNLLPGYNTTVNNQGPSTYEEGISPYIPVVPGPRQAVISQPPTPLNLLPGYITPEDDNGCSTPMLFHMPANDEDENETPMLTPTLIPNQNLEELD